MLRNSSGGPIGFPPITDNGTDGGDGTTIVEVAPLKVTRFEVTGGYRFETTAIATPWGATDATGAGGKARYGYEGQAPNISGLTGRLYWEDGTVSALTGLTTTPRFFTEEHITVVGATELVRVPVKVYHPSAPEVYVTVHYAGVHPFAAQALSDSDIASVFWL